VDADPGRRVSVAIDAAGAAGVHPFTYHLPARHADVAEGEAVLVEFGRRQALGIVIGVDPAPPDRPTKPVLARVRSDGPLLPPLSVALAREIAGHYLAPPSLVVRAMLPPGMLERLELVAEARPGGPADLAGLEPGDAAILDRLTDGPRRVRDLAASEGRASLVRRLRSLEAVGRLDLDWVLAAAGAGPRWARRVALTPAGLSAAQELRAGTRPTGRPLGPRQVELLDELLGPAGDGLPEPQLAAHLASRHGAAGLAGLARRGLVLIEVVEQPRRPLAGRAPGTRGTRPVGTPLSSEQAAAVELIARAIETRDATPLLLDGVTGAGKSAIYAEAIRIALDRGRPALLLVPEIALALPLVDRLRADLDARIALLHSGLADGERADEWRRIRAGEVEVVVGTRLAVLAPLADVGVIIVDEEHDPAYKSDRTPRFQARDVALRLAARAGAAMILGSATPAVETEGRARGGEYRRVRLPNRTAGQRPVVSVVDLRAELAAGNRALLSRPLHDALAALDPTLGEQAILVINRRGSASAVLCRDCGHVQACPDCERPLVYHQSGGTLRCHHCGRAWPLPDRCPTCGSARIRHLGGGTERLERDVREALPALRVGRLDRDVAERQGAAARIIDAFTAGRIDVLVGTSLVTKGLDIPGVTLVGIVSADVALNLPDERAAERTYQLLVQAVGRAGRGGLPGRAFIQSYQPDHPAVVAAASGSPTSFYDAELELRRRFFSPPFARLIKLTVALPDRAAAEAEATRYAGELRTRAATHRSRLEVSGPAPAYIARRAERWRYNVLLRGEEPASLLAVPPELPWSVDVDPETLL
jgi:primosomal protein N' (replication factor Y)